MLYHYHHQNHIYQSPLIITRIYKIVQHNHNMSLEREIILDRQFLSDSKHKNKTQTHDLIINIE